MESNPEEHNLATFNNRANAERQLERRRQLSLEADQLIEQIRARPGFERFLRFPSFDQLVDASNGPIVLLYESRPSCTAVILHAGSAMKFNLDKATDEDLKSFLLSCFRT